MGECIDGKRAAQLTIFDWVVSLCEIQETAGTMVLVENPVGATSWNQPSIQRLRSAPVVFEDISHLCMFGVKDPRSRRALKRPVRYLTNCRQILGFVVRTCPNKHVHGLVKGLTNAYRSSSRGHTRAWAQPVFRGAESDAVKRLEAYPAEDVEMDLAGTAIPDESHEEPQPEETKLSEEVPNAVWLAIHKNLRHPSKELLCRAFRIGGANKITIRAASELNLPPKVFLALSVSLHCTCSGHDCVLFLWCVLVRV